jgi:hypothetical protein
MTPALGQGPSASSACALQLDEDSKLDCHNQRDCAPFPDTERMAISLSESLVEDEVTADKRNPP